jgi:hypothetical protein
MLLNASADDVSFVVPGGPYAQQWLQVLDTSHPQDDPGEEPVAADTQVRVPPRSVMLMRRA